MIFRTGSVLIVGKCDENVLIVIYNFLKNILNDEYTNICQNIKYGEGHHEVSLKKTKKIRRKTIVIETNL
jgi:hypothetical protein